MLKREKRYFNKKSFNDSFIKYFEYPLGENTPFVSLKNSVRILGRMKKRKAMIEKWHTLEDLNKNSGLNLSEVQRVARYGKMKKRGEIRLSRVNVYGGRRLMIGFGGSQYKLCPFEYDRMLEIEKRTARALEEGVDTAYLSEKLGVGTTFVGQCIKIGKEFGLLHPFNVTNIPFGIPDRYLIPRKEAESWIRGELNIPGPTRYNRLRQTLSKEEIIELLKKESEGVSLKDIANQTGKRPNTLAIIIAQGEQLGLLHPYRYKAGKVSEFILPQDEARRIISGELRLPSRRKIRNLREELSEDEVRHVIMGELGGMSLTKIAEQTGADIQYLRRTLNVGEQLGLLHPVNHRYKSGRVGEYIFSQDEAKRLIRGELKIPRPRMIEKLKQLERLSVNGIDEELVQDESCPIDKSELWQRLKQGDSWAFQVLSLLYAPTTKRLVLQYRFKANEEELEFFVQQSLFEALIQAGPVSPKNYIPVLIEENLRQRIREERPLWISLDKERPQKSGNTRLIDIVNEGGKLNF